MGRRALGSWRAQVAYNAQPVKGDRGISVSKTVRYTLHASVVVVDEAKAT